MTLRAEAKMKARLRGVDLEGELARVMASPPSPQMRGLVQEWIARLQSLLAALRRTERAERRERRRSR